SYWTKNYRTGIEVDDPEALRRRYAYQDPIYTLPEAGQRWWAAQHPQQNPAADAAAAASRQAAERSAVVG
ncbi:MAG: lysine 2,3-aminomutase, partial [Micromonosporaceae bacterium]